MAKKVNFLANEGCYGIAIGMQLGMNHEEIIDYIFEDLDAWSQLALPVSSDYEDDDRGIADRIDSATLKLAFAARLQNPTKAIFNVIEDLTHIKEELGTND